jgi:dienelactone hydrolase
VSAERRSVSGAASGAAWRALLAVIFVLSAAPARGAAEPLPDIAGAATVSVPGVGVSLGGYLFRPARRTRAVPAVLLLHAAGGNAEDLADTARVLAEQGYFALALSLRGSRGSEGQEDCGARQADDTVEALNWLARQPGVDASRLGIIGYGQGGQVALLAASYTTLPRAVVAYYPVTDTRRLRETTAYGPVRVYVATHCDPRHAGVVSPVARVASISAAVLLIHGAADDRIPSSQSELMHAALQAAGKQSELHLLPEATHEFTPEELEESWPWVARFLGRHQMLSLDSRDAQQQKRVNIFTEQGWAFKLGLRGIQTIRALGPVKREKVTLLQNPHVDGRTDEIREFFFADGLYVKALFPGRQQNAYLLQEVTITRSRYKAKFGLNLGTTRKALEDKLGQPDGMQPGFVEYFHSMGIGTARIHFKDDRIVKLEWEFRAD